MGTGWGCDGFVNYTIHCPIIRTKSGQLVLPDEDPRGGTGFSFREKNKKDQMGGRGKNAGFGNPAKQFGRAGQVLVIGMMVLNASIAETRGM